MMPARKLVQSVLIGFGVALLAPVNFASAGETLVISTIEKKVKKVTKRFEPLAAYLERTLADDGVDAVEINIVTNRAALIEGLRNGDIDIYLDSPLIMAEIIHETGARPALRRWKKGVAEYHSVFFTRASSDIETLEQLRGHVLAFERGFSTSGYLLPKATLIEKGFLLAEVSRSDARVANDEIGYVFSNDDNNTVLWVLKGKVAAGVVDSGTFDQMVARRPNDFRVIARSESVPRHVVSYRAGLDPAVADAVTKVLLNVHTTETGRAVLKAAKTARFDRFPGGADQTFARMDRILGHLNEPLTN